MVKSPPIPEAEAIGITIRNMRHDKGMTQDRLCRRVRGLSQAALSNYERGIRTVPEPILRKIAKALGHDNEHAIKARAARNEVSAR